MKKLIALFAVICLCLHFSALAEENKAVTRIEFIAYVMSGIEIINSDKDPMFTDLSKTDKYYNYAAAAKEYEIVNGYADNTLHPYEKLTREDAIVILCRAYKIKPVSDIYIKNFSDYKEISEYARGYVSAAVLNNILYYEKGTDFGPKGNISIDEATRLEESFKKYINTTMHFSFGYPKEAEEKVYGAISISIKVSRPCTVYYKLVPVSGYLGGFRPTEKDINNFITAVSAADTVIDINIYPEDWGEYDLYITAVDNDGNYAEAERVADVTAHRYYAGKGTEKEPYLIYNREQLEGIKYYPDSCFRLEEDIVITREWDPINIESKGYIGFAGVLDGNYHKITNLTVNKYSKNAGLFTAVYGGKIKKLYVDATIKGSYNVGIIAGLLEGGSVSECFVTGRVYASGNNAGGIVGSNNGEIKDSVSAAYIVEASAYAGGLAGTNRGDILNCLSAAYSVSADMYASGAAGVNIGGRISRNVCANLYASDIITTRSGRVTTNKQLGRTSGNYCYDKMMSDSTVDFDLDSHDGLEVSWKELTSPGFYSDVMGWDTRNIWRNSISEDFRLLSLRGFETVDMIKGITMYAPVKIYTEQELVKVKDNPDYHYILMNDISIDYDSKWEMIGSDEESAFNGTFDGNNHTISGMHIENSEDIDKYGMFGVISSGTVRNLKLINFSLEGNSLAGAIAAENYGYIENCSVSGKMFAKGKGTILSAGGIAGNNYGFIENSSADIRIRAEGQVSTLGGIAANNEGYIYDTFYTGNLQIEKRVNNSNAVIGGIAGINTSGMIYNSCAKPNITSKAYTNYLGGIAGIMNGGEIYKASSSGKIYANSSDSKDSSAYVGSIAGLTPAGLIMNGFSSAYVYANANNVYAGGIVGYNQNASVQNTYSTSEISVNGGIFNDNAANFAGGICGYSEAGFISDNAALNEVIESNGYASPICNVQSEGASCFNNYFRSDMELDSAEIGFINEEESVDIDIMKDPGFFFLPVAEGGRLGWNNEDVWYIDNNYSFPLLMGVKGKL